jgi:L-alanine-DL-glutamate epimerase-like enolase superfamily enzyme
MTKGNTIDRITTMVLTFPTDPGPEADGTLEWSATDMLIVLAHVRDMQGIGYSYTNAGAADVVEDTLKPRIIGKNAFDTNLCWLEMCRAIRNEGDSGLAMMAVSAVDVALWDLKAKLLGVSLAALLGPARTHIPVYGSGGFTNYTNSRLASELGGWVEAGIKQVKMKIGYDTVTETKRVKTARDAIGQDRGLFVDANGAYDRKQALAIAHALMPYNVTWFEEPVYHRDFAGTRYVRENSPPGLEVAAGEYGFEKTYFRRLVDGHVIDVLQADATRCGITGFMQASELADAHSVPFSSHCAPSIHVHTCCAARTARHVEYFHDHVRIEQIIFDGALKPVDGSLTPDWSRPGLGIDLKAADARKYAKHAGGND